LSSERTRSIRSLGGSARRQFTRLGWALEDRLLQAEQRRGVLGPAHRRWRDVTDHHHYWSAYDWSRQGEEWNASPEWKHALIDDVLLRWIPPGVTTLEIGPGAGRWTDVLVSRASHLTLVDVSERPLELCRQRFGENGHVSYILTQGSKLPGVTTDSVGAVWSFDVFVHLARQIRRTTWRRYHGCSHLGAWPLSTMLTDAIGASCRHGKAGAPRCHAIYSPPWQHSGA